MQKVKIISHRSILFIFLIIICGILAYSNTFKVPFHFDDDPNITENSLIRNSEFFIAPEKYCSQFSPVSDESYICNTIRTRYVGYLTFGVNYWINGLDVSGYHIVNVAIHIANALLLYYLIILTFRTPFLRDSSLREHTRLIALFSSLIFVAHPIQTQAVTYIVQRFASLATMFYILSLIMYIEVRLKIDSGYRLFAIFTSYLISVVFAVCAMKTKEIAITLPLVVCFYELFFFRGSIPKRFLCLIPILVTLIIIPLSLLNTDMPLGSIMNEMREKSRVLTSMSRLDYFYTEMRVIVTYIRLLLLPIHQNLDYDYPIYHSFFNADVGLSFLLLSIILFFAGYLFYFSRRADSYFRIISFGILWFFVTLSVESSIIPIVDVIFEHRIYLPSVGFFIAILTGLFGISEKLRLKWEITYKVLIVLLSGIIIILMSATFARNIVWQDTVRLWADIVKKSPNKVRSVYNLAHAYQEKKQYVQAIDIYKRVINLDSNFLGAYYNIAIIYQNEKQFDKAIEYYKKVINIDYKYFEAYNKIANIYLNLGKNDKALKYYELAITISPVNDLVYYNRGRLYLNMNEYDKAVEDFTRAIVINPNSEKYFKDRGRAYANKKRLNNAIQDFTNAIQLNLNNGEVYALRGLAFQLRGENMNALSDYQKSCSLGYHQACDAVRKYFK